MKPTIPLEVEREYNEAFTRAQLRHIAKLHGIPTGRNKIDTIIRLYGVGVVTPNPSEAKKGLNRSIFETFMEMVSESTLFNNLFNIYDYEKKENIDFL